MSYEYGFYTEIEDPAVHIAAVNDSRAECSENGDAESKAAQKQRIRRIVNQLSPDSEVCFDERALGLIFIVRLAKSGLILSPAIRWSLDDAAGLSDDKMRHLIAKIASEVA